MPDCSDLFKKQESVKSVLTEQETKKQDQET